MCVFFLLLRDAAAWRRRESTSGRRAAGWSSCFGVGTASRVEPELKRVSARGTSAPQGRDAKRTARCAGGVLAERVWCCSVADASGREQGVHAPRGPARASDYHTTGGAGPTAFAYVDADVMREAVSERALCARHIAVHWTTGWHWDV